MGNVLQNYKKIESRDGGQCARMCNAGMHGIPEELKKQVEICESDIPKKFPKTGVTITSLVSQTTMTEKEKTYKALA